MKRLVTIIEDEKEIAELIKRFLVQNNFEVRHFETAEAYFAAPSIEGSIYLVDWNLPGMKGTDLIRSVRQKDKFSPIFMISGFNKAEEVVEGLKAGADDYLVKPFNYDELVVRVENAWNKMDQLKGSLMNYGLKLIPEANSIMREGVILNLTSREYTIFAHLYENREKASTRDELIACFPEGENVAVRNIDVHIFSLRKKLQKVGLGVETVWGVGYKIVIEETTPAQNDKV